MYSSWDEYYQKEGEIYPDQELENNYSETVKVLRKEGCRKVLDLGCGTGRHSLALAKDGFQVTGMDCSETAVSMAKEKAEKEDLEIDLLVGDMENIPFPENEFDAVYCDGVIHHGRKKKITKTLKEIKRVLKPGGLLFLYRILKKSGKEKGEEVEKDTFVNLKNHPEGKVPHHFFLKQELEELIENSKMDTVELKEVKYKTETPWNGKIVLNLIARNR